MPEIQEKCVILQYHVKSLSKRFYTIFGQFIGPELKIRIYYLAVLISEKSTVARQEELRASTESRITNGAREQSLSPPQANA